MCLYRAMYAWTTIININMLLFWRCFCCCCCYSWFHVFPFNFLVFCQANSSGPNFSFSLTSLNSYYTLCLWCSYRDAILHIAAPRIVYISRLFHPSKRARQSTSEKKGAQPLSANALISRWPNFVPSIFQWRQHKILKDSHAHTDALTFILSQCSLMYFCLLDVAITNGVNAAAAIGFAQQIFYSFHHGSNEQDWILSEPSGICMRATHTVSIPIDYSRLEW